MANKKNNSRTRRNIKPNIKASASAKQTSRRLGEMRCDHVRTSIRIASPCCWFCSSLDPLDRASSACSRWLSLASKARSLSNMTRRGASMVRDQLEPHARKATAIVETARGVFLIPLGLTQGDRNRAWYLDERKNKVSNASEHSDWHACASRAWQMDRRAFNGATEIRQTARHCSSEHAHHPFHAKSNPATLCSSIIQKGTGSLASGEAGAQTPTASPMDAGRPGLERT